MILCGVQDYVKIYFILNVLAARLDCVVKHFIDFPSISLPVTVHGFKLHNIEYIYGILL